MTTPVRPEGNSSYDRAATLARHPHPSETDLARALVFAVLAVADAIRETRAGGEAK